MTLTTRRLILPGLAAVLLLSVPGCGDGRLTCHPVRGQVFVDGKPAHGAKVYFFPVNPPSDHRANCPIGQVDESGSFTVTTYAEGDGAPAGEYILCFDWPSLHPIKQTFDGGDRLDGKYYSKEASQFRFTVNPGPNETQRFDLKAPPKRERPKEGGPLGGGN